MSEITDMQPPQDLIHLPGYQALSAQQQRLVIASYTHRSLRLVEMFDRHYNQCLSALFRNGVEVYAAGRSNDSRDLQAEIEAHIPDADEFGEQEASYAQNAFIALSRQAGNSDHWIFTTFARTPIMSLVDTYLTGLRKALPAEKLDELKHARGACAVDVLRLIERYPLCPASLVELLGRIDGTHYRDYPNGEVMVLMLGSDLPGYPYYLSSVENILAEADGHDTESIVELYEGWFEKGWLDQEIDLIGQGIDPTVGMNERLCFSHCMNNGGTSKLYIDFNPGPGGTVGQVMRFLHDPDNYEVIAPSFDHYLQQLIDDDYAFVFDDED